VVDSAISPCSIERCSGRIDDGVDDRTAPVRIGGQPDHDDRCGPECAIAHCTRRIIRRITRCRVLFLVLDMVVEIDDDEGVVGGPLLDRLRVGEEMVQTRDPHRLLRHVHDRTQRARRRVPAGRVPNSW
jgi:hypothetical protein